MGQIMAGWNSGLAICASQRQPQPQGMAACLLYPMKGQVGVVAADVSCWRSWQAGLGGKLLGVGTRTPLQHSDSA